MTLERMIWWAERLEVICERERAAVRAAQKDR